MFHYRRMLSVLLVLSFASVVGVALGAASGGASGTTSWDTSGNPSGGGGEMTLPLRGLMPSNYVYVRSCAS